MVLTMTSKLIIKATRQLDRAAAAKGRNGVYSLAFLAAMNAIGALLASRQDRLAGLRRPDSVWDLVPIVAPELAAEASYFRERMRTCSLADANQPNAVTRDEAEEMLSQASLFITAIEKILADGG
jgi:hypothetical protein